MLRRRAPWLRLAAALALLPLTFPGRAEAAAGCNLPPTRQIADRPWAQNLLDVERVWPLTTGLGQQVAVVDTGVDGKHPQLKGHVAQGYDVLTGQRDGDHDCHGHGTFVAGIIAAQHEDGIGFVGVAPGVTIVPIREANSSDVNVGDLANAINVAAGIQSVGAINVSTTTASDDARLREAVQLALSNGKVVVAAAGNDAQGGNAAQYPAVYPGVLSVGAIDSKGQRAQYSETVGVGVVAPGQDLVSTGAGGPGQAASPAGGTSYAAPYVTGVVALVRAYHPNLSPAAVVHRIEVTADHPAGALPDPQYGWGVVDPYQAVTAVLPEEGNQPVLRPSRSPVPLAAAPADSHDRRPEVAYGLAAAAVALAVVAFVAVLLVPAGRRRGWRSALRD
jgi:type VII secretion-associated serine protease mycosin